MRSDYSPYLVRLVVVALISIAIAFLINEGAYLLQRDKIDRSPKTIRLVIPAGTTERVAQGQPAPGIPDKMTFIVGDVLEVKNEDAQPHQLGPIWVPPGSTGSIVLKEANRFSYSCSFAPDRYLGLDVRQTAGFATRLVGLMISAPTLAVFLFIYSLLVVPVKPKQAKASSQSANVGGGL
jgi:hypothetical protein